MIRPILEYANTVWSPYTKKDIAKIERVQRQSARFIMADYSYHTGANPGGVMGVKRPPLPESYWESLKSGVVA